MYCPLRAGGEKGRVRLVLIWWFPPTLQDEPGRFRRIGEAVEEKKKKKYNANNLHTRLVGSTLPLLGMQLQATWPFSPLNGWAMSPCLGWRASTDKLTDDDNGRLWVVVPGH